MHISIVGQGIAGTCLAWACIQNDVSFTVFDAASHVRSSSQTAAGIMNPVTGRRLVRTWMQEQLWMHASTFYSAIEDVLGASFLQKYELLKGITSEDMLQQAKKFIQDEQALDVVLESSSPLFTSSFQSVYGVLRIQNAMRLQLDKILKLSKHYFEENGNFTKKEIVAKMISKHDDSYVIDGEAFDAVIFAEGYRAIYNPYFRDLPFRPAKGEALIVRIPDLKLTAPIQHGVTFAPLEDDLYWIGSTYAWAELSELPDPKRVRILEQRLIDVLKIPYELVDVKAAIRPASSDRRPMLGNSVIDDKIYILNGLGTKGCSLAPYFASVLIAHVTDGVPLPIEVDIKRFRTKE